MSLLAGQSCPHQLDTLLKGRSDEIVFLPEIKITDASMWRPQELGEIILKRSEESGSQGGLRSRMGSRLSPSTLEASPVYRSFQTPRAALGKPISKKQKGRNYAED